MALEPFVLRWGMDGIRELSTWTVALRNEDSRLGEMYKFELDEFSSSKFYLLKKKKHTEKYLPLKTTYQDSCTSDPLNVLQIIIIWW